MVVSRWAAPVPRRMRNRWNAWVCFLCVVGPTFAFGRFGSKPRSALLVLVALHGQSPQKGKYKDYKIYFLGGNLVIIRGILGSASPACACTRHLPSSSHLPPARRMTWLRPPARILEALPRPLWIERSHTRGVW